MRLHRTLTAVLGLALLLPAAANAQQTGVFRLASRGMLGFYSEPVNNAQNAAERVVIDIVPNSPAQRAGLAKGDVLLRINGRPAGQFIMNESFQPGDTVVLRVRRDGRERDITVVAAERSTGVYSMTIPDSIDRRVSIIMDRVRSGVDTIHMPRIRMQRLGDDSVTTIIIGADTIVAGGVRGGFRYELVHPDSIRGFYRGDLPRMLADSVRLRLFSDSTATRIFSNAEGHAFSFAFPDSAFARPIDILTSGAFFGMRAVAGAELAPLNPDLAQYFGTNDGVLVIHAASNTPAARAGLRGGDVIVQVNGTAVRTLAELRRGIDQARGGDVSLRVLRRGQNVDVKLDRN